VGGAFTAGLAVLAAALVAIWFLSMSQSQPGPGTPMLLGHLLAVLIAVPLQRVADLRNDWVGRTASIAVLVVTVLVGAFFWWG
jgi:hypothetical protein